MYEKHRGEVYLYLSRTKNHKGETAEKASKTRSHNSDKSRGKDNRGEEEEGRR
jgi:hypothetical protein